ncbi:MAG TPA: hypothetical protein VJ548_06385 [Azospira sp.]|nr:hypothetical protein [Azospira sp.]
MAAGAPRGGLSPLQRLPLLLLALAALATGVGGGLLRLGWDFPLPPAVAGNGAAFHGPLMVSAFFGTVIALERAVALAATWTYLGPALAGAAGLSLILGAPPALGALLACGGAAILLAGSIIVWRRQPALHNLTLALGAACWLLGNLLWLAGQPVPAIAPAWIAFLTLTIAGERLELSRFLPPSPVARRVFVLPLALVLLGALLTPALPTAGAPIVGLGLAALALWLLKQDIARRTVKQQGLTRFIAVSLLAGYFWLALGGLTLLLGGPLSGSGPIYDAALHALLVGFVFSMVFGHAPIIFPAVARVQIPYHPVFYLPLAVLHASLALRLAGDALGQHGLRALGGAGNGLALLLFVLTMVGSVLRGRRQAAQAR